MPVKEYMSNKIIRDRIALVGKAEHVPASFTASGLNQTVEDVVTIGTCAGRAVKGDNALDAIWHNDHNLLRNWDI